MSTPIDDHRIEKALEGQTKLAALVTVLERELSEAREELENWKASGIHSCHAACKRPLCVAGRRIKDMHAALRRVEVLATGLDKHGPQGLSKRTARAILAALAPVLPGVEAPPFMDTTI